jgi:hypothetical protein
LKKAKKLYGAVVKGKRITSLAYLSKYCDEKAGFSIAFQRLLHAICTGKRYTKRNYELTLIQKRAKRLRLGVRL